MGSIPEDPEEQERYEHHDAEWPYIPELAYRWLEALKDAGGLPDKKGYKIQHKSDGGMCLKATHVENPINTAPHTDAKSIRLDNGQVLWLRHSLERQASEGYRSVRVIDKSQRTEKAILAALTVLESRPIDIERMRSALYLVDDLSPETLRRLRQQLTIKFDAEWPDPASGEDSEEFYDRLEQAWDNEKRAEQAYADLQPRSLQYITGLLRYYRPDLDSYSREDQLALLQQTATRVNGLLEAMAKLTGFLEYGTPEGMPKAVGDAGRDVRAAELRDIEGLTYREISAKLSAKLDISHSPDYKGDYPATRKAVGRGRDILERAFGKEGWSEFVQEGRADRLWWRSLSNKERFVETLAVELGITTRDKEGLIQALAKGLEEDAEEIRWHYFD